MNILSRPTAGTAVTVEKPEGAIALGFDPHEASLERDGGDLIFIFEDGARITIKDYFSDDSGLSEFMFSNGTILTGMELLATFDPVTQPHTAAGPDAPCPPPTSDIPGLDNNLLLDMTNNCAGDSLNLTELLGTLSETYDEITVNGDEGDTVRLGSDWQKGNLVNGYFEYSNEEGDTILIQQQLAIICGV